VGYHIIGELGRVWTTNFILNFGPALSGVSERLTRLEKINGSVLLDLVRVTSEINNTMQMDLMKIAAASAEEPAIFGMAG
jgi:hypothetical protein